MKAQTTNPAPYCAYNSGIAVKGYSGAISKVTLGTLNNATTFGNLPAAYNSTTGAVQQLYTYYDNVAPPNLTAGSTQTISLEFKSWFDGEPVWYAAYIDFNHDNAFDTTTEMVIDQAHANINGFIPSNNAPSIITATRSRTFTVPANAMTGTTRMRVIRGQRTLYWNDSVSRLSSCSSYINSSVNKWSFGEVEDYDVSITAPIPPPSFIGLSATGVHSRGATLNGIVNANGISTTVTFEYGITPSYGNVAIASPSIITGNTNTTITNTRSNLMSDTLYHYRIKAVAGGVTYYSADATFRTSVPASISNAYTEEELKVYPNPSTGIVHIEMPATGNDVRIQVFNVLGTTVFSTQERVNGLKTISLGTLPAGMYEMRIQSGEKSTRRSIQILH